MKFSAYALLLLLVEEYNGLIEDKGSDIANIAKLAKNGVSNQSSNQYFSSLQDMDNDDDEFEYRLEELEDDMIMALITKKSRVRKIRSLDDVRTPTKRRKYNHTDRQLLHTNPVTNARKIFTFEHSIWYQNYVLYPRHDNLAWNKTFRNRFRTTHAGFMEIVGLCRENELLSTWAESGATHRFSGKKVYPMELLVLCALRYLGRSWTIDDLVESTAMNYETIRQFIHKFIEFGSTVLYDKYVTLPLTTESLKDCEAEFLMAGFPGCVGSTDASHIVMEKCSYRLRQLHLGYKLAHTARTYNLSVNHRRKILSSTSGHPARFNDKTLAIFDTFLMKLKNGFFTDKYKFELYDFDVDGNIIIMKYNGCYVIVDNGYLAWSTTVPPMKNTNNRSEIRFSEWLESMRKDVECAFGILKGRWRILKHGIRLHGLLSCDRVWLTCCALHNFLLDIDGLAQLWGAESVEGESFAAQRLNNPAACRTRDLSGVGLGNDCTGRGGRRKQMLSKKISLFNLMAQLM